MELGGLVESKVTDLVVKVVPAQSPTIGFLQPQVGLTLSFRRTLHSNGPYVV